MITRKIVKLKPIIGEMSLVGVSLSYNDYPAKFGNYFSLSNGPHIVNMWAENFKEVVRRFGLQEVEITILSDEKSSVGLVTDSKITKKWLCKPCFTGVYASDELQASCINFKVRAEDFMRKYSVLDGQGNMDGEFVPLCIAMMAIKDVLDGKLEL